MHSSPVPPCPETEVVVVGEALIDIIDTAAGPVEFPGGPGMNVAFGLGRPGRHNGRPARSGRANTGRTDPISGTGPDFPKELR
jgi:fructokinase